MTMQYDVKAVEVTTSGSALAYGARVKGLTLSFASGGTISLKDGGSSGTVKFSYTAPAAAGSVHILLPGEGILFNTSIYAALSSATVTIYYG